MVKVRERCRTARGCYFGKIAVVSEELVIRRSFRLHVIHLSANHLLLLTALFWGMARKADIHSMTAGKAAKECSRISPFLFLLLLGLVGCGKKQSQNARKPPAINVEVVR